MEEKKRRILMVAPPGFGKTTVLSQGFFWSRKGEGAIGWLTGDRLDDAATMIAYVAVALEIHIEGLVELADHAPGRALQALLAAIETRDSHFILFLDNGCECREDVLIAVVEPLLRLAPANFSIICALRSPNEALAPHADHIIDHDDLRFELATVKQLCGRGISAQRARAVLRESQGWPTLVGALIAQYRRSTGRPSIDGAIVDFARKRLFPLLQPDDMNALVKLSALRDFDYSLARHFVSEASLSRLTSLAFITPAAARGSLGLALNPVLAGLAQARAGQGADAIKRQAAKELTRRGQYIAATRLAVDVGDDAIVMEIIDACDPIRTFLGPGIAHLEKITGLIPEAMADRNIRISCVGIISLLKNGKPRKARALMETVAAKLGSTAVGDIHPPELAIDFITAKTLLNIHQGRPVLDDIAVLARLADRSSVDGPFVESWIATLKTHLAQSMGEIAEARCAALTGIQSSGRFGGRYATFYHHCDLAVVEGIAGETERARTLLKRAAEDYRDVVRSDFRLPFIVDTFLIELDHEENPHDLRHMGRLRTICRRLPRLEGWPEVFAAAFRSYSEKLVLAQDPQGAFAVLDAGRRYAVAEDIPPLLFILDHQRALLHMILGDPQRAKRAIAAYACIDDRAIMARTWREVEACVEARAAIHAIEPDSNFPALLAAALSFATVHGLGRSKVRYDGLTGTRGFRSALASAMDRNDGKRRLIQVANPFLTPRALEVMKALRGGMSDKEIALLLGISPHGVRYHLKRVYAQMKVQTRDEACRTAVAAGLLSR